MHQFKPFACLKLHLECKMKTLSCLYHCTRPFQWSSSSQGILGGMETTGKIRQIKITENNFFVEVKQLKVYQSTQTYVLLAAWIFPK